MDLIKILIFTDQRSGASRLEAILEEMGYLVIKTVDKFQEAIRTFYATNPDLILLDISYKGIQKGIQVARRITEDQQLAKPLIFLTAKKDKELFEKVKQLGPFAYLVKPFNKHSLQHSIELAFIRFSREAGSISSGIYSSENINPSQLFIKKGKKIIKVPTRNILLVEVESKYCTLFSKEGKFLLRISLKELMEILPARDFLRIHRNFLVNVNEIIEVDLANNTVCIGERTLPISRNYKKDIANKFLVLT